MVGDDVELVQIAPLPTPGRKPSQMPELPRGARADVSSRFQPLKSANHGNFAGVGSPDAESRSRLPIDGHGMCAHLFVDAVVAALVKKIEILVREQGGLVRVVSGLMGVAD